MAILADLMPDLKLKIQGNKCCNGDRVVYNKGKGDFSTRSCSSTCCVTVNSSENRKTWEQFERILDTHLQDRIKERAFRRTDISCGVKKRKGLPMTVEDFHRLLQEVEEVRRQTIAVKSTLKAARAHYQSQTIDLSTTDRIFYPISPDPRIWVNIGNDQFEPFDRQRVLDYLQSLLVVPELDVDNARKIVGYVIGQIEQLELTETVTKEKIVELALQGLKIENYEVERPQVPGVVSDAVFRKRVEELTDEEFDTFARVISRLTRPQTLRGDELEASDVSVVTYSV